MKRVLQDTSTVLSSLANLAIIVGVIFAIITIRNDLLKMKADRAQRSADLILRLDDKLEKYQDVIDALDTDDKGLKVFEPDGQFSESHVEAYVGVYDLI